MSVKMLDIHDIFSDAIARHSDEERRRFLDAACGSDPTVRARVDALLSAHSAAGGFFGGQSSAPAATDIRPGAEIPGSLVGRYKLLEQIGEGGMGIVFVAEQTDPVRRRVALKIIKPGMDTKQVIARFEAERQALAMMDHPNIARVLDAGTTEASRPYFVMELVRGMPITEYSDKAKQSPRQRLELFVDVCQAVQHAHQKGIIHRDLKPSNVMVTMQDGRPVVKVIDFGVAKAVGQHLTERTVYTALTQLVGTPLYMSPEQAELTSHDVDTRSDVYSLGVLLYELLTGQTPFDKETLAKAGLDEMRRIIREDEPLRPSRRFSTLGAQAISTISQHRSLDERRLGKILCGELDWIVMKALEKDRSRRYESASALAADIQRYLSDEPVLACPPTAMYRFQKFARKHKPAFATATAIAVCLLLGTTVSAWQAIRATAAEEQAAANEAQAKVSAQQADEKAQEATTQRDEAQKQRDEVKALNEKLVATQTELRATLYAAYIHMAHQAWEWGGIERASDALELAKPKAGETDLCGFEWHYLNRLCHAELFTIKAHSGEIWRLAYSPDGKRLITSSLGPDHAVKVWDAQTGQPLLSCQGHTNSVGAIAVSPDGQRLASASDDKTVRVWDARTGRALHTLTHSSAVQDVVFSPDGKRLASSVRLGSSDQSYSGDVKVWDAITGEELLPLKGNGGRLAYSPDGKLLACGNSPRQPPNGAPQQPGDIKVWDAYTGQEVRSLKFPSNRVTFSPDGKRLASAGKVWDVETGAELFKLSGGFGAFSPDGERLAGAPFARAIKVWDAHNGQELVIMKGRYEGPSVNVELSFSPDGRQLACAMGSNVKLWDAQTGAEIGMLIGHTADVLRIAFSPDGKHLASSSRDGMVKVWDAHPSQRPIVLKGHTNGLSRVAFSPDGSQLASASYDDTVRIWDWRAGRELFTLKGHQSRVTNARFSPDGQRLVSASHDKTAKVWDARTGELLHTLTGHTAQLWSVAYSPDGQRIASASDDKTLKIWDAKTFEELFTIQHSSQFWYVAFSPDSQRLATASADNQVRLWDAQTKKLLRTFSGHTDDLEQVVFSPDGKCLASACDDKTVRIWDTQSGETIRTLKHISAVWDVAYSPDGKRIISGTATGEVVIWDATSGQELLTFKGHASQVNGVAVSPDGHWLASDGPENSVIVWDATPLPEISGTGRPNDE